MSIRPGVVSSFPPPPPYYTKYANEETSLRPPQPIEGEYLVFNTPFNTNQLFPTPTLHLYNSNADTKTNLKRLTTSMLRQYLTVLDTMINAPDRTGIKIREMQLIVENIHFLMNQSRTHKSEEVLVMIMKSQNQKRVEILNNLEEQKSNLRELLSHLRELVRDEAADQDNEMESLPDISVAETGATAVRNQVRTNQINKYQEDISLLQDIISEGA